MTTTPPSPSLTLSLHCPHVQRSQEVAKLGDQLQSCERDRKELETKVSEPLVLGSVLLAWQLLQLSPKLLQGFKEAPTGGLCVIGFVFSDSAYRGEEESDFQSRVAASGGRLRQEPAREDEM